jgi:hypothetical protein
MSDADRGAGHSAERGAPTVVTTAAAAVIAATLVALGFGTGFVAPSTPAFPAQVTDESGALGPAFHPGVILSGGSNATTTFLGGIGVYSQVTGFSLPVFAALTLGPSGPTVENETSEVENYFFEGGVYAIGWNGSSWLVGGQRSPEGSDQGALIALDGNSILNLTGRIASYFVGGGVWSVGWNGTTWLIGGNSSAGPTLLAWDGGPLQDLSSQIVGHGSEPWVQMLSWNGKEWLVGGHGVFGLWTGAEYVDLFPSSPFRDGGTFSSAWNGTAWLVGGDGNELVFVRGETLSVATTLPAAFDRLALMIVSANGGWFVAGKGRGAGEAFVPELAFWSGNPSSSPTDYSSALPPSFDAGDVQGGVSAPEFGADAVLMVGVGAYNATTGHGVGAMAVLEPESG